MQADSEFKPAWWLSSPHAQTIWPSKLRKLGLPETQCERIELPDGDFLDLHWTGPEQAAATIIILHGLGGSIHSHYIKGILPVLAQNDYRVCLMHARTAGGVINRLPRSYHAGETQDLRYLIELVKTRTPAMPLMAVAYSIGGSMLLNYLQRYRNDSHLMAAIAISVPYDLADCARVLDTGFARVYQTHILAGLKKTAIRKFTAIKNVLDPRRLRAIKSIYEYDQLVTAPLHGFASAEVYYAQCSASNKLSTIDTNTLLIHAVDDPFMSPHTIPDKSILSKHVTLERYDKGGHVGFMSGNIPFAPKYWLEQRIPVYLKNALDEA